MIAHRKRLLLAGLIVVFAVALLAGSAAQPATVRSDDIIVQPQTNCQCYYNGAIGLWCYKCCNFSGCYDLYCQAGGC